jgi:hypothetical protein
MLVTRGGEGELRCCDQPMQLRGSTPQAATAGEAGSKADTSTSS